MAKQRAANVKSEQGTAPSQVQPDYGSFSEPVNPPLTVGGITLAESKELKARNDTLDSLNKEFEQLQRVIIIVRNEHRTFTQGLVNSRGLDMRNQYSIDNETGSITLVARFVEPEEVAEPIQEGEAAQ